ncbi:MAG: class I SAM-dependent methyltransferase [Micavibrio aeruginosavorus]|uniref:Class I SAM-dependent methyltransferase n=1 Tax=Micavibrio aeruginosavorus TaxID=349221 RepID=A0A7T5UIP6_9BACT|nr:MAG: class I SAM-dependent methyltransferase [Micavibrio aeruginosavorus]
MATAWDREDFVNAWNQTYGLDMSKAPIRPGLIFPLLAEKIASFENLVLADLGCGNGNLIRHFSRTDFSKWIGVDGGSAVIKSAADNTRDSRVEYQHADLTRPLAVETHSVDIVTNVFVIEEIPFQDLKGMFANVKDILKPDGRAFFFTNHPSHALLQDLDAVRTGQPNAKFPGHQGYFDHQGTSYVLSVMNAQDKQPVMANYHHKTFSDIMNAAASADLQLVEMGEIPQGVIRLDDWKNHTPNAGDSPRFLYLQLKA